MNKTIKTLETQDGVNTIDMCNGTANRFYWLRNLGDTTIHVSTHDNIEIDGDNTAMLSPNDVIMLEDYDGYLYVLGAGKIEIHQQANAICPFKLAPATSGGDANSDTSGETTYDLFTYNDDKIVMIIRKIICSITNNNGKTLPTCLYCVECTEFAGFTEGVEIEIPYDFFPDECFSSAGRGDRIFVYDTIQGEVSLGLYGTYGLFKDFENHRCYMRPEAFDDTTTATTNIHIFYRIIANDDDNVEQHPYTFGNYIRNLFYPYYNVTNIWDGKPIKQLVVCDNVALPNNSVAEYFYADGIGVNSINPDNFRINRELSYIEDANGARYDLNTKDWTCYITADSVYISTTMDASAYKAYIVVDWTRRKY